MWQFETWQIKKLRLCEMVPSLRSNHIHLINYYTRGMLSRSVQLKNADALCQKLAIHQKLGKQFINQAFVHKALIVTLVHA